MRKIVVDIGGTFLRYEIIPNIKGKVLLKDIEPIDFLGKLIKSFKINKVAISFAGQVCCGKIISSPNIKISPMNIETLFREKFGVDLIIENDLNCAALAESKFFKKDNIVAIYSGTGLGSGIIYKGEIYRGCKNIAGEIGHIPYKEAPFLCGCGKSNCLELYASGSGIRKWIKVENCSEFKISDLLNSKKEECKKIAENYIDSLAYGIGTIATLLNPTLVVLGGGVIKSATYLVEPIKEKLEHYIFKETLKNLRIEISQLEEGSLEGAKLLLGN